MMRNMRFAGSANVVVRGIFLVLMIGSMRSAAPANIEATALLQGDPKRSRVPEVDMLWLSHYPSGKLTKLTTRRIYYADFSPDGKKVAFSVNDSLYIINNDGSGLTPHFRGIGIFSWTTNGIMWISNDTLHRYIPETRMRHKHPVRLREDTKKQCQDGNYSEIAVLMSRDGYRMWTQSDFDPSSIDSIYCGVRGYDRGGHAYMHWASDFGSRKTIWRSEWGHGSGMTSNGYLMLVELGGHRKLGITRQDGTTLSTLYGYYEYDPPYPPGMESRPHPVSVNNDSIIGARALCRENQTCPPNVNYYFYNWRTSKMLGKFVLPDSTRDDAIHSFTFWYGPLPNPHDNTPYILLDKPDLRFAMDGQTIPSVQQITVTNSGAGTLSKVQVSVSPESPWLKVTIGGSGGNTQILSNAVDPARLTQDLSQATVTVNGGGAANKVSYTVLAYKGLALAPPTDLTVLASGDSLLDAKLGWKDNTSGESGFIVERREKDGSWGEIARTTANTQMYIDKNLILNAYYDFRVKAFMDGTNEVVSGYSNVAGLEIGGVAWIRVSAPKEGHVLNKGSTVHIQWTANIIDQVYIEFSIDGGKSWQLVTPEGGIFATSDVWGSYPWVLPDSEATEAILRVASYTEDVMGYSGRFGISHTASIHNKDRMPAGRIFADKSQLSESARYTINGRRIGSATIKGDRQSTTGMVLFFTKQGLVRKVHIDR